MRVNKLKASSFAAHVPSPISFLWGRLGQSFSHCTGCTPNVYARRYILVIKVIGVQCTTKVQVRRAIVKVRKHFLKEYWKKYTLRKNC